MRKYNINANLVRTNEHLYDNTNSAVHVNGSTREWFRTIVGVTQGFLLSPTLYNIFLKRNMSDAQEEHDEKIRLGGKPLPIGGLPITLMLLLKKTIATGPS